MEERCSCGHPGKGPIFFYFIITKKVSRVIVRNIPLCGIYFPGDDELEAEIEFEGARSDYSYDRLKELDPTAANRIHPNDQRKVCI